MNTVAKQVYITEDKANSNEYLNNSCKIIEDAAFMQPQRMLLDISDEEFDEKLKKTMISADRTQADLRRNREARRSGKKVSRHRR